MADGFQVVTPENMPLPDAGQWYSTVVAQHMGL